MQGAQMFIAKFVRFTCCVLGTVCVILYSDGKTVKAERRKTMSTNDLVMKVEQLKELEELLEEVKAEAESVRDEIKQEMMAQDTEELEVGQYIIRWTSVLTNRFDTTAFKKVLPDVYKAYTKQITSRRFSIA